VKELYKGIGMKRCGYAGGAMYFSHCWILKPVIRCEKISHIEPKHTIWDTSYLSFQFPIKSGISEYLVLLCP